MMLRIEDVLLKEMNSAYGEIDSTADSLDIGHLVGIMTLRHFQRCGNKLLVLIGCAARKKLINGKPPLHLLFHSIIQAKKLSFRSVG